MEMLNGITVNDRISHYTAMQKPDFNAQLAYRMDKRDVKLTEEFQMKVIRTHQWLSENEEGQTPPTLERMYETMIIAMLNRIDLEAVREHKDDERFQNDMQYRRRKILEHEEKALKFNNEFFDTEFLIECVCDMYDLQYSRYDADVLPRKRRIYKNPVQTFVMWGV